VAEPQSQFDLYAYSEKRVPRGGQQTQRFASFRHPGSTSLSTIMMAVSIEKYTSAPLRFWLP
jgi:hypothetical protein